MVENLPVTDQEVPEKEKKGVPHSPFTAETVARELGKEFLKAMSNRGGGFKWTPERWAKILTARFLGLSKAECSAYAGIHRASLDNWLKEFEELNLSFCFAKPLGTVGLVDALLAVADEHTIRWLLERRSESFAPPVKRTEQKVEQEAVEIRVVDVDTASDSVSVPKEISGYDPEELEG